MLSTTLLSLLSEFLLQVRCLTLEDLSIKFNFLIRPDAV